MGENSELITIQGFLRQGTGKSYCRKLRKNNRIPANLLGAKENSLLELDDKWLSKAWKGGKKFNLKLNNEIKPVLIKELQISPVRREAVHVDLQNL